MRCLMYVLTMLVFLQSSLVLAQEDKIKRKQTLSFEDELVEGTSTKPELFYLMEKRKLDYRKLLKLRENFLPEMRKTANDLQKNRGSD